MEAYIKFISEEFGFFVAITKKYLPPHLQYLSQDLAQDAIVLAIEKINSFDSSKGNLKSWLFRVTQNLCFDYARKYNKVSLIPLNNVEYKISTEEVVDNTLNKLRVKKILSAIKHLNKRDQEIIKYKFIYNFSGRELSVLLDIPEKQINVYVKRAKEKLLIILKAA